MVKFLLFFQTIDVKPENDLKSRVQKVCLSFWDWILMDEAKHKQQKGQQPALL
jgi:hypothetical protein